MRKYLIAVGVVALLVGGTVVAADTASMVGKRVQSVASVTINGEQLSSAVIIDGKSYAPVRDIVEAVGADVTWSKGEVKITDETKLLTAKLKSLEAQITLVNDSINTAESLIDEWTAAITTMPDDLSVHYEDMITSAESDIIKYNKQLNQLENEKEDVIASLTGASK